MRVIILMFFADPVGDGPRVTVPSVLASAAITVGVDVTLVLGMVPGALFDLLGPWEYSLGDHGLALPIVDADLEARLRARMEEVETRCWPTSRRGPLRRRRPPGT